jgi:outer membrane biosynthesis protein TonB
MPEHTRSARERSRSPRHEDERPRRQRDDRLRFKGDDRIPVAKADKRKTGDKEKKETEETKQKTETEEKKERKERKERKEKKEKKEKERQKPTEPMIIVTVNDRLGTKAAIPCLASDSVRKWALQSRTRREVLKTSQVYSKRRSLHVSAVNRTRLC